MPVLSRRLLTAASEIGISDSIADIGTDHGKLIVYALERGLAKRAFAVDISPKSLEKAKRNAEDRGLTDQVTFYCGDGLKPLDCRPDVVVIAGMGGNETVKILSEGSKQKKLVLIPHQDAHLVRKYLCENGYRIEKDYYVEDGKYYAVLVAVEGVQTEPYTDEDFWLGKNKPKTDAFIERNNKRLADIERILQEQRVKPNALQPDIRQEYEVLKQWSK